MEQWYNFRPVANRRVISLEEAEERLEARGRHTTSTSQWLEKAAGLKGGNGGDLEDDALSDSDDADRFKTQAGDTDSDDDDNEYDKKKKRRKKGGAGGGVGVKQEPIEDEAKAGDDVGEAPGARGIVKAEGDDWEHDAGASDDEVAGEGMGDEIEMVDADAKPPPKPHGPTGGGGADDDDEELDEEGAKLKRLLGREEEAEMAAELGGISDDEDSDSEFVDPDQEELHPFLLQQRNKAEQAQVQKAQAAARAAQQAAAAAAAAVVKTEPVAAGVKRPRETSPGAANVPVKAQKTEAKPEAATRPIEVALRAILRGGSKVTTKDVTKQLRKKGLLNTDADKDELKSTIGRVAKIMKEGNASYVVLK
jgi:type II secretory pathway pseudopilin PulG